jgi:hypothetical protein
MGRHWPPSWRSLPGIDQNSGDRGAIVDRKVTPINFRSEFRMS